MTNISDIRRDNLRRLIKQWDGPKALSAKLDEKHVKVSTSFLVQMAGPHPSREVSEKTSRKIEQALGLPDHWMDAPSEHPIEAVPVNVDVVTETIRLVGQTCEQAGVKVSHDKFAQLVSLAYKHALETGNGPKPTFVTELIQLLR